MTTAAELVKSMDASSAKPLGSAHKSLHGCLQALARLPLEDIAKALGKSVSTACRVRDGEQSVTLTEAFVLIDLAGRKVVDKSKYCVDKAMYDSMAAVATKAMSNPEIARQLIWDDE